jgi:hypothetical protein
MKDIFLAVFGGIIGVMFAEFQSWAPRLAERLVFWAGRLVPAELRPRMIEEWLGHVADIPAPLSKLLVAFGFSIAAVQVRFERAGAVRFMDLLVSALPLLFLAPLIGLIAVGLRIEGGRRPVFDRIRRPGADGTTFDALVFGLAYGSSGEGEASLRPFSRQVFRLGLFELPTLLNILRGEMSFFGPGVWGCGCPTCRRQRDAAEKPGYLTFERVEDAARLSLGVDAPPPSTPARRYLRCLWLTVRLTFKLDPRVWG